MAELSTISSIKSKQAYLDFGAGEEYFFQGVWINTNNILWSILKRYINYT